ncbi:MAG: arabinose efflux permease family protein [Actinomycetia bacterium]|nr:arabinose efflux permease family protein [Actinomycetes bacterium]
MAVSESRDDIEQVEDAILDGDVALRRGTAQAAFRHRNFRIAYIGVFASNIGTWMQNVLLGAWAYDLTHSSVFVGVLFFAQLGPLLFLSTIGGLLADSVDRRRLLVGLQLTQLLLSLGLAGLAISHHPSKLGVVALVSAIGIANALAAPGLSAILPTLVPREDLPGAVALMSVQMNLSRVIGPAIGAAIYSKLGASPVFTINAGTYVFAVIGLIWAQYPRRVGAVVEERGFARIASAFRIARTDPLVRDILLMLFSFSFFSLAFVGLMPVLASKNLGIATKSVAYGLLYAAFGLGAALGAVSVGTVFASIAKVRLLRPGFAAFAVLLTAFTLVRSPAPAYPVALLLGYAYFVVITSMSTVLQSYVSDAVRGRVMALWIMGFGGTVPVGVLLGGWLADRVSITGVFLAGAVWAVVLAVGSDARRLVARGATNV